MTKPRAEASALMPWPQFVRAAAVPGRADAPNTVAPGTSARLAELAAKLPPWGLALRFRVDAEPKAAPALDDSYAYSMSAAGSTVDVHADTEWGAMAALATLAQFGPLAGEVRDAPRHPWRGLMIDTVRHFISLASLKRTVDAMWFYKLNVLHLHLTDDQGFRFRSRRHPELASADAYAPAELADLVAYAAARGVRVVPELDMPGHTTSWLAGQPSWSLGGRPAAAPSVRFGVHDTGIDPANPAVLAAVAVLFQELAEVFPDDCLHFGGDEAVALDGETQATFLRRAAAEAAALGKRPMGWDECLHPRLPRRTIVQAWRGLAARNAALAAGFDCVVSAPYYLDLFYPADAHAVPPDADADAPLGADNPRLAHVREAMDALADGFRRAQPALPVADAPGRLLGGEACLWTELVTDELLDARLWSRLPVVAEQLWRGGDAPESYARLTASRRVLADLGVICADDAAFHRWPAALRPLLEMLEPVKCYRRLLGERLLAERTGGLGASSAPRPYDATTALTRPVDALPPESLVSRRAEADLAAGRAMARWTAGWRQQREALRRHPQWREELGAASEALASIADLVDGRREGDAAELAGPFGEYLLPVAYAVAAGEGDAAN